MPPIPNLKLIGVGIVAIVLFLSHLWFYNHGKGVEKAAQQKAYIQALQAKDAEIQRQASINKQVSNDYQTKLTDLDARYRDVLARPPVVRMQSCPGNRLSATARSAPGTPPAAPGNVVSGPLETHPERDLGPDLVLMAKDADLCVQRLLALQDWARKP